VSLWQMQRALQAEAAANTNADQARLNAEEAKRNAKQAFAALRSMTVEVVERKFAQGTALTEDDRAFLRGIIAQYDAFAAIKGDDEDSRWVRAEGRLRVGIMRYRLSELQEAEKDYDQALSIYKQLAADFPSRPEFRQELAVSHNNRGNLLHDTGRLQEAAQAHDQALSIRKQLAADFPSRPEFRREPHHGQPGRPGGRAGPADEAIPNPPGARDLLRRRGPLPGAQPGWEPAGDRGGGGRGAPLGAGRRRGAALPARPRCCACG